MRNKTWLYKLLHNGFRKYFPPLARLLRLKQWEGEIWHRLATPRWDKRIILSTSNGIRMKIRLNHLTDLTAVFGRVDEEEVGKIVYNLPEGGVFVDAGAHIGRYTLKAAKSVGPTGRVISFEPDSANYDLLVENCKLNGFEWVEAERCALGSEDGTIMLISGTDAATNTVVTDWYSVLQPGDDIVDARKAEVPQRRLEGLLKRKDLRSVDLT